MQEGFLQLCSGRLPLQDLPHVSPRSITFCIISASTDFEKEREVLQNNAYPLLYEEFRSKYGIQFRAIDIRQGLEKVNYDELDYWDLFHDFKQKYAISTHDCVPVVLLGQKFGLPLLPKRIPTKVFHLIRATLRAHRNPFTSQYAILDSWYLQDDNTQLDDGDCEHALVPARNLIPDIDSNDRGLKEAAVAEWKSISIVLASLIKIGIGICLKEKMIDDHTACELLTFELDSGVSHLLANSNLSQFRPIIFEREIVDLKNYLNENRASAFIDIESDDETGEKKAEGDLKDLLQELSDRISTFTSIDRHFSVLWRHPDGINQHLHQEYLTDFCEAFIDAAKAAVEVRITNKHLHAEQEIIRIFDDAYTSLERCRVLSPFCVGHETVVDAVVSYCTDMSPESNHVLILHGKNNSGKLPVVAQSVTKIQHRISQLQAQSNGDNKTSNDKINKCIASAMVIVRMIMFEEQMRDVLNGIFHQIRACFEIDTQSTPQTFEALGEAIGDCPIILLIGGAERLVDDFGARVPLSSMIPLNMAQNIRLVLTSVDESQIASVANQSWVLNVNPLTPESCYEFIHSFLSTRNRRLTDNQWMKVKQGLSQVCSMFHASLLCDKLLNLTSDCNIEWNSPLELNGFINEIFAQLENKFGSKMVRHCFSLISLSHNGLTDSEIIDLLSLDDVVLDDLLVPIQDGIRRFPTSVWQLLKQDIHLLVSEASYDGHFVIFWVNEDVANAVEERYAQSDELRKSLHFMMADYFLGTWSAVSKPVSSASSAEETMSANRLMPSQQLVYVSGEKNFYNDRQFRQLPRHLSLSDRIPELNNLVLFNYDWLYYKSASLGIEETLKDFELVPQNIEVSLVEETIRKASGTLHENLKNLAAELSGNLVTYSYLYKNIKNLVRQSDVRGCQHNIFVPTYSYSKLPGSALQSTVECPSRMQSIFLRDRILYVKLHDDQNMYRYDLSSSKMLPEVRMSTGEMHLSTDQQYALIVDDTKRNHLRVHRLLDGSYVGHILPLNWIDTVPFEEKYMFRLKKIKVGRELVACIVTSRVSYVLIANLATCQPVHVFKPERRAALCELTPDEKFILTNNGEQVLVFEIGNGIQTSAVDLLASPKQLMFTKDGSRAFILCEGEQKVVILYIDSKGAIEMSYKIMFENSLANDHLVDMRVSQAEQLLLVRAEKNVIVYEFEKDAIVAHIRRPREIPDEFKMPNSDFNRINFTEAEFGFEDRVVITSIFRDVLVWEVADSKPLVMLHAPTGVLTYLLVDQTLNMLIGYIDHSQEIHLWSLQGAFTDGTVIDCLTAAVNKISASNKQPRAIACCQNSDEMGVIDLSTGFLTDLYSHEGVVLDCAITSCGNYAVATVRQRSPNTTNVVWSLMERKILEEFGNVPGYLLPCNSSNGVYIIHQAQLSYNQPFEVNHISFKGESKVDIIDCEVGVQYVLSRPFLTANDHLMVCLSADQREVSTGRYVDPFIFTWNTQTKQTRNIGPSMLSAFSLIVRLIDVRPCRRDARVAVLYSEHYDHSTSNSNAESKAKGVMLFDIETFCLQQLATDMIPPSLKPNYIEFSTDGDFCIDTTSNALYSVEAATILQTAGSSELQFRCFALVDSLMIFTSKSFVYATRVPECSLAGKIDVHNTITTVQLLKDSILLVGTSAGNILSFRILDTVSERTIIEAVQSIPSREMLDSERARSWDRLVPSPEGHIDYSRSVSKTKNMVDGAQHSKSDEGSATMDRARSCALM